MLHYETIDPTTLELLKSLQELSGLEDTRLVGGTALALHLGHRKSVDLDIFGSIGFSGEDIKNLLSPKHSIQALKESPNINTYLIDGIKVDFVNYSYEWIDSIKKEDSLRLAEVKDIAAMKISAIIGRGTKKDFIDVYFLLKKYSLSEILQFYSTKYPDGSLFIALKSLTYFEDAEADPMPQMLIAANWHEVKKAITEAVKTYLQTSRSAI